KVADGKIQMPGSSYRVIVVPECKYIPLETFKQLLALAENGATVVFENNLPADVPGAGDLERRRGEFKKLLAKIQLGIYANIAVTKMNDGQVVVGMPQSALNFAKVVRESLADAGLSFTRRSFDGGWHYFIANRGEKNFDGWVTLGRAAKSVVILDPITGNSGVAASRQNAGSIQVRLQLQAGESAILRAFANQEVKGPAWNYLQTNGQPVEITGSWDVKFIAGGPVLPALVSTTNLASWTELGDTNSQSFAGTALYTLAFDAPGLVSSPAAGGTAPDTLKREHQTYFLDLGNVCQSARVRVNGKDYGTLITPPFRVVADNLKPTGNQLEVEVTSVSANRIRDLDRRGVPWKNFKDINIVNVNYRPFNAADWPLTDCGLLGPVTLTGVLPLPAGRCFLARRL